MGAAAPFFAEVPHYKAIRSSIPKEKTGQREVLHVKYCKTDTQRNELADENVPYTSDAKTQ